MGQLPVDGSGPPVGVRPRPAGRRTSQRAVRQDAELPRDRCGVEWQGRVPLALRADISSEGRTQPGGPRVGHRAGGCGRVARSSIVRRRHWWSHATRADPSRYHALVPLREHVRVPDLRSVRRRSSPARARPALADRQASPRVVRRGDRHARHPSRHRGGHGGEGASPRGSPPKAAHADPVSCTRPTAACWRQVRLIGVLHPGGERAAPFRIVADFKPPSAASKRGSPPIPELALPADTDGHRGAPDAYKYTVAHPFRDLSFSSPWRLGFQTTTSNRKDGQLTPFQLFSSRVSTTTPASRSTTPAMPMARTGVQRRDRGIYRTSAATLLHRLRPRSSDRTRGVAAGGDPAIPVARLRHSACPDIPRSDSGRSIGAASPHTVDTRARRSSLVRRSVHRPSPHRRRRSAAASVPRHRQGSDAAVQFAACPSTPRHGAGGHSRCQRCRRCTPRSCGAPNRKSWWPYWCRSLG